MPQIHVTADVSPDAQIGEGVTVWQFAQIREDCVVGENVTIGRGAYIGKGVSIGANSKVQNYALVYEPALLEEGVFIGPGAILTNDEFPRSINSDGSKKKNTDWDLVGVTIREGASIGAGSICIAPVEVGAWSLVAAGSTVTKDVPPFALVAGTPAKRIRWVGKAGLPLVLDESGRYICTKTGTRYIESEPNTLIEIIELK